MASGPKRYQLTVRVGTTSDVAPKVSDNGLSAANPRHILLLVHGYNNSHDDAEKSYALFIDNLLDAFGDQRSAPDAIAKFHWPGDESTLLGTTVGYPLDIRHARDAAQRLATYLVTFDNSISRRITMVGHSMGCRLILEALGTLGTASMPGIAIVGLMAAASPVDFVRRNARLFRTGNPPHKVWKFFSEQDGVLQAGFPLGQWLAYQWQIENDNYTEAIGRFGHPDEYGNPRQTTNGHSDYWGDATIASFLVKQIDATTPTDIPANALAVRQLLPAAQLPGRSLPTRP